MQNGVLDLVGDEPSFPRVRKYARAERLRDTCHNEDG